MLLIVIVAIACNSEKKKTKAIIETYKLQDTAIGIAGFWVSEDYYSLLLESKSPRKAQLNARIIEIPERSIESAEMLVNFHEMESECRFLLSPKGYEMWNVRNDSLLSKYADVEVVSPTSIKIKNELFVKVDIVELAHLEYLVAEGVLFKGNYTNSKNQEIELMDNGDIKGLNGVNYYQIKADYIGPGLNVDMIALGPNAEEVVNYGFQFKGDTLNIYELKCSNFDKTNHQCIDNKFGKLVHQLWRIDN
jgi:hypothetical protein